MATLCPNKTHPDWIKLTEAIGETAAYKAFLHNGEDTPTGKKIDWYIKRHQEIENPKTKTGVRKKLSIPYFGSSKALAMSRKRIGNFNDKQGTSHRLEGEQIGQSDTYKFVLTLNDTPVNQEAKRERKLAREGDNAFFQPQLFALPNKEESRPTYTEREQQKLNELENQLKGIMANYNITVEQFDNFKEVYDVDAIGVADIANKLIRIQDPSVLPEEASHMIIEMLPDIGLKRGLLNLARQSKLYSQVADDYRNIYNSEEEIVKEVAGKLLGQAFQDKVFEDNSMARKIKKSAEYIWNWIKQFFGRKPGTQEQLKKITRQLADNVLADNVTLDPTQLEGNKAVFFSAKADSKFNKTKNAKQILQNSINVLNDKIADLSRRERGKKGDESNFLKKKINLREKLQKNLANKQYVLGIQNFVLNAHTELVDEKSSINAKKKMDEYYTHFTEEAMPINQIAKNLRTMNRYFKAYSPTIDMIQDVLQADNEVTEVLKEQLTKEQFEDLESAVNVVREQLYYVDTKYKELGKILIEKLFKDTTSQTDLDIAQALEFLEKDENSFTRVLYSLADSRDPISRIIDKIVKKAKETARLATQDLTIQMINDLKALEKQGYKNEDFVYEKDYKGNYTGFFVDKVNRGEWVKARDAYKKTLKGVTLESELEQLWSKFYEENGSLRNPNPKVYTDKNKALEKLNEVQAAHLKKSINIKESLDNLIPNQFGNKYLTPQFRKDLVERVKAGGPSQVGEAMRDSLYEREDDTEFGGTNTTEDGKEVKFLPVHFTQRLDNPNVNLSRDLTATMSAYAAMANDYNEMNKVVHSLEIAKDIVAERKVLKNASPKAKKAWDDIRGKKYTLDDVKNNKHLVLAEGRTTDNYRRLESYFDMIIYGKLKGDKGQTIGSSRVSKAKAADLFGSYVALNNLAFNLYAGINNTVLGNLLTWQEGITNEWFSQKSLLKSR